MQGFENRKFQRTYEYVKAGSAEALHLQPVKRWLKICPKSAAYIYRLCTACKNPEGGKMHFSGKKLLLRCLQLPRRGLGIR